MRPKIIIVKFSGKNLLKKCEGPSNRIPIACTTKHRVITAVGFHLVTALWTNRQVIKKAAIYIA
jgi:hypothetical protein